LAKGRLAAANGAKSRRRSATAHVATTQNNPATAPPASRIILYKNDVILDSGASHHMTPYCDALSLIEPTLTQVILPDGATVDSDESGLLRPSVYCQQHKKRFIVPLLETLLIRGLCLTLWSVAAFNACGHAILS
jgi:hypothetical protein